MGGKEAVHCILHASTCNRPRKYVRLRQTQEHTYKTEGPARTCRTGPS